MPDKMERGTELKVLDHGYVRLIDYMGSDETIIEAARMSTGKGFVDWEHDAGLLEYLWSHRHTTPFEMVELHVEVQAPILVFRQWHRSRTQSYNEFSSRYAQMPDLHYVPDLDRIQAQSKTNKQGSADPIDEALAGSIQGRWADEQEEIYDNYDLAIENGVSKEVARLNTPVSRYSKMRAKTDLKNWLGFEDLRIRPGAQWETRQYALALGQIISSLWPRTWALFEEYTLYGCHFSRTEMAAIRMLLSTKQDVIMDEKRAKVFWDKLSHGGEEIQS